MATDTFTIAASADDGYVQFTTGSGDAIFAAVANVYFGEFGGTQTFHGFFRFAGATLPNAEQINSAQLNLTRGTDEFNAGPTLVVGADAADNSAQIASWTDLVGRALTAATTAWSPLAGWVTASVDVTAIVREIVNRPGWASGNALQLLVKDNGSSNTYSTARSQDSGSGSAQLVVNHGALPFVRRRPLLVCQAVRKAARG